MEIQKYRSELEAVIPGVLDAYLALKAPNGMGIYTSNGAFYNHTLFGRDASMVAKFVTDFDHQAARETIVALAALQGTKHDDVTQEAPGRIHHEYRDMTTWHGGWFERRALTFFLKRWGGTDKQVLTYYALETTALYIRLVYKYATHVDRAILEKKVRQADDKSATIAESVAMASDWLISQIDDRGYLLSVRPNGWALPFQTFQDSSTAFPRRDGSLANFKKGIVYTESQAFAIDALEEVTELLDDHAQRHVWQDAAHTMRRALIDNFWNENDEFFGSAIDTNGLVDMPSVTAGWTLNNSLWDELSKKQREETLGKLVKRLFSNDFLTPVGLRSRALSAPQPLEGVVEYHGRLTVWPMFTFMVIEGLRHHRLHGLAEQLENRLVNTINACEGFEEFFVVDHDGALLRPTNRRSSEQRMSAQMIPEKHIAFTVIPAMVLAHRVMNSKRSWPKPAAWQKKLDKEVLSSIDHVELAKPDTARQAMPAMIPTEFLRYSGNARSVWYFFKQWRQM